jgi:hypothetical protein
MQAARSPMPKTGATAEPSAEIKPNPQPPSLNASKKTKPKLVRDSFSMPEADHALLADLKGRALSVQRATKKNELLRAGLHALMRLNAKQLKVALNRLTVV